MYSTEKNKEKLQTLQKVCGRREQTGKVKEKKF
jgi:hypothetical protein